MTRPTAEFRALTITANGGKPEMDERGHYRYRYAITVQSDATGDKIQFPFHASNADYDAGKRGLGPDELLYAFRCFVSDADAGSQPFADFAADFGYDADSISARDTWKACKRARDKFDRLHHTATDPADVLEALSDLGID